MGLVSTSPTELELGKPELVSKGPVQVSKLAEPECITPPVGMEVRIENPALREDKDKVAIRVLLDTGSQKASYVSCSYVDQCRLKTRRKRGIPPSSGVWRQPQRITHVSDVRLEFGGLIFNQEGPVAPLRSCDVILSMDWISQHALSTDWEKGIWSLRDKKGTLGTFRGIDAWLVQGHDLLAPISEVKGPGDDDPAPWAEISTEDPVLVSAAKKLLEGHRSLFGPPVRRMSSLWLKELQEKLEVLQKNGFTRPSTSPWSSPVLFAPVPLPKSYVSA
ncbi:hypothetical protein CROQUDRAFT_85723 [Cronartium quercuum f. sp. fusiforme G11]|uniref:Uncharacterized protein n=1 Tax=Cronartium quercuum f. sp. fusiforme G11 TaxID=708437 RepID=A0A9P6NVA5_9BASI|nr:hypothetical protein CROQUDRAFT_85723 [Cronartium quercuum f. sp. fusiforme G11]